MSRTRRVRIVATAGVISLLVAGCGGGDAGRSGGQGATAITVLLPNPSAVNVFGLCAAIGEGFLKDEGIDVTVRAVDGSAAVLQAMVAGQAQIGLPGPGPVLNARSNGEDIRMFFNAYPQSLFGLIVAENSPIITVPDIKGTVVGVGTAEGAEVAFVEAILSDAGLQQGRDYTTLPVGDGGQAAAAFERQDVDAYAAAISDMAIMEARGFALREITPDKFLSLFGNGYAATGDYIDQNPDVIQGFTNALLKGNDWALQNKEGTLKDCAEINPDEGQDAELASALYDTATNRSQPTGEDPVGFFPPAGWEAWQKNLVDSGQLSGPMEDLTSAYTNEFVDNAN